MSDDSGASISDNSSENRSIKDCINVKRSQLRTVIFSRKLSCSSHIYLKEIDAAEATLLEIQNEESKEFELYLRLHKECELLKQIFHHVIQYVDCCKLQLKTTNRFSVLVNKLALKENCLTEIMSENLRDLCGEPDVERLTEISSNVYNFMENFESVKDLQRKFEGQKENYEVALKNFKMVLEFMSINLKDLDKLKKQFEQVLWECQHSRCLSMKNMHQVKQRSLHFLGRISAILGKSNGEVKEVSCQLGTLLEEMGDVFVRNHKQNDEILLCKNELHTGQLN